jgi:hypothetical protein
MTAGASPRSWPAASPVLDHSYPRACLREFDEELLDVGAGGGKQVREPKQVAKIRFRLS